MKKIAFLITCHNRKDNTKKCLSSLFNAIIPSNTEINVFLVDDGSSDGTSEMVNNEFPNVNVISGNGHLYWNKGMRLAWESASNYCRFNFYVWLNDDVILEPFSLTELIDCFSEASNNNNQLVIICGACKESYESNEFSYGGRINGDIKVIPNGTLQECNLINGNVVLISEEVFRILGNLSHEFTHGMGDFDYGLRALKKGIKNYTTKNYIGLCGTNKNKPTWANPEFSLKSRYKNFKSPTGLNIDEYIVFRKKHWPNSWILDVLKAYTKLLMPSFYERIKK